MTRISNESGAINLAQGFPDFDPPKEMTDRLEVVSHEGPHQYPITMGAPNFRQAIARKCGHFMGRTIDPETEIVATIGSTEAMVDTLFALTNPGDRVVMFSPFFENYRAQVIMADCEPVFVPLNPPTFSFDPNVLEDAFRGGAKAIIICNPSNPSGKVFTEEELKTIADLCIRYDVYAIMDEVYEHIIYDGRKHVYMNSLPGMWERTVSCSSLSKTYSVTGWRLGYAIAPENIMARIRQYHDFNAVGQPGAGMMRTAVVLLLTMPMAASSAMIADMVSALVSPGTAIMSSPTEHTQVMASSLSSVSAPEEAAAIMPSSSLTGINAPESPPTEAGRHHAALFHRVVQQSASAAVVPWVPQTSRPISSRIRATLSPTAGVGARERSTMPNGVLSRRLASCATS